jgi:hypothetical protein
MNRVTIFGREPELWTAAIVALFASLAQFNLDWLSAGQAFAIGGLLVSIVNGLTTRPIGPGVFVGIATAGIAVLTEYGTSLSEGQVNAISAVVLTVFTLILRPQATPGTSAPRTRPSTAEKVSRNNIMH